MEKGSIMGDDFISDNEFNPDPQSISDVWNNAKIKTNEQMQSSIFDSEKDTAIRNASDPSNYSIDSIESKGSKLLPALENEGYSFKTDKTEDPNKMWIYAHSPSGEKVGMAQFLKNNENKTLKPLTATVSKDHQRKGIATSMYHIMEQEPENKNFKIIPGDNQSHEAKELWKSFDDKEPDKYADGGEVSSAPDFVPDTSFVPDQQPSSIISKPLAPQQSASPDFVPDNNFVPDSDKYGSTGQQLITGLEGAAKGVAGPLATLAETSLFGVKPEDIRGRAEENPIIHGGSELAGFAGSALTGIGEAGVVANIGDAAARAAGVGLEGASTISKIASHGIKTGAEMMAIQTGDEISRAITQDPNQSIGTAAINIGLSGIIGGAGGAILGSVSPLWKSSIEKANVPKLIDDAKSQYNFRQTNPDVPATITDELTTRMSEVDNMRSQMSNLKAESLARAMPEVTPENTAKIDTQIQEISDKMSSNIKKASENSYLKNAVPKLEQDYKDFMDVVTNPESNYQQKFNAIDDLKRSQQAKANYNLTAEDSALGAFTKQTARDLRLSLEDSKVWGDAATIQEKVNAAITDSIKSEKDASSKFTSKLMGERIADPAKVITLVNQLEKGKAGLKTDVFNNYLKNTEKLADTINKIHTDAGLDAPISLTPTPAINHTLNNTSKGTVLGNWLFDKGLGNIVGHGTAEVAGAGIGAITGHPLVGAYLGEKALGPLFSSIARPLLENATKSESAKGVVDYVSNVIKGDKILNTATKNIFKSGAEILPENIIPDKDSRERLEKSLNHMDVAENTAKIGEGIAHYLPDHSASAVSTAVTAKNYLSSLKPTSIKNNQLDKQYPPSNIEKQKYNRQLDIAQQPLLVLEHIKNGSLQSQDIQTLNVIYPNLHKKIVNSLYEHMTSALTEGHKIPYYQHSGLSMIFENPVDSTLTAQGMQSIISASSQMAQQSQDMASGKQHKVSGSTLSQINKVNALYQTPGQAREASKRD